MAKFDFETEKKVKEFIKGSFQWAQEWRSKNIDDDMVKSMRLYMSQIDEDEDMWQWLRARLFIPKTNSVVETIIPKMFGFEPTFSVTPKETTDERQAGIMEAVLKYYLMKMDYPFKLILWARNNAIYGWNPVKAVWRTQKKMMRRPLSSEEINTYLAMDEEPPDQIDYPLVTFDGPDIILVDPMDYYWTPSSYDLDDMLFQIHRTERSYDYLKSMGRRGVYQNIDQIEKRSGSEKGTRPFQEAKRERDEIISSVHRDAVIPKTYDEFELYETECYLPLVDKGGKLIWDDDAEPIPVVATLCELETLIRFDRVPWYYRDHNYFKSNFIPLQGKFTGIGVPQLIEGLQKALNFRHCMAIDNMNLSTNTMWLRRRGAGIKDFQLRNRPGGIIDTTDMKGLEPLKVNDMTGTNLQYAQILDELIEDALSISRLTKGIESGSELNRTATGILALQKAAEIKIKQRQLEFGWQALRKLGQFFIQMIQENAPPELIIRITGDMEPIVVTPEDLIGQFDIAPYSGIENEVDKQSRQDRLMMAYDRLSKSPMAASYNWPEMDRRILEALDIKDVAKIIPSQLTKMLPKMMEMGGMLPGGSGGGMEPPEEMPAEPRSPLPTEQERLRLVG